MLFVYFFKGNVLWELLCLAIPWSQSLKMALKRLLCSSALQILSPPAVP